MNTRAVPPDFVSNHTAHRDDVPLLVDAESGELRCKVSGLTLEGGVTVDNSGVEARLGALTESAPASDSASSGLNGLLRRLLGKFPALVSGRLPVDGSGVTQPVSGTLTANLGTLNGAATQTTLAAIDTKLGAALPLPSGAATAAAQATGNSALAAIDTKLGAALPLPTGAATAAAQATAQGTLDTIGSRVGIAPSADTATHGINRTRSVNLGAAAIAVKAGAGNLLGLTLINPNVGQAAYLKFYDTAQGSVTVGTTAVVDTIPIPAATEEEPGMLVIAPSAFPVLPRFATAITAAVTAGQADNSTAAPAAGLLAQFYHA